MVMERRRCLGLLLKMFSQAHHRAALFCSNSTGRRRFSANNANSFYVRQCFQCSLVYKHTRQGYKISLHCAYLFFSIFFFQILWPAGKWDGRTERNAHASSECYMDICVWCNHQQQLTYTNTVRPRRWAWTVVTIIIMSNVELKEYAIFHWDGDHGYAYAVCLFIRRILLNTGIC